jgi:integrase/recombinase XerD
VASAPSDDLEAKVEAWLESLRSDNTRAAYRRDLVVFGRWVRSLALHPRKVTAAQVEQFADHCAGAGDSDATVRRRMAAVTSFYRHAGTSWSSSNPGTAADRPAPSPDAAVVALSAADADAVWSAAVSLGPKTATLVGLVLLDGFKAHELLRLDVGDLQRVGAGYAVRVGGQDGSTHVRLDPRTSAALRRYLGDRRAGPLLYGDNPTRERARLTRYGVDYLVRRTAVSAGLATPVTVNVLRHTQTELARRAAD